MLIEWDRKHVLPTYCSVFQIDMKIIKIILILIGMHILGSMIFFGCASGPNYILAGPIIGLLFGWFIIVFEAFGFLLIWWLYKPSSKEGWIRITGFAILFGAIGALVAAMVIPKEQNHELKYWISGLLAGFGSAIFCFSCIHKMKLTDLTEQTNALDRATAHRD